MLALLKGLRRTSQALIFPQRAIPLHALLISCGYSHETRTTYDWHGLKRGPKEFVLFQYTVEGWGKLRYERQTFRVSPGEAMLLAMPHDHRYWLPAESPGWTFFYLCMTGRDIVNAWRRILGQLGPVVRFPARSPTLHLAAGIVHDVLRGTVRSPFQASARAYSLTMALLDEFTAPTPGQPRPPFIDTVVRFCQDHRHRPISIAELSGIAGCSRYHFSRQFKAWMGMPPGQYILDQRLRLSAARLQQSTCSIKELAAQCGFSDANYFCRAFRKSFGLSPGQFKRSG